MKISKAYQKHVFCLEGDWEDDLKKKSSVNASLVFMEQNCGIKYIHKHCGTRDGLEYYLKKYKQKKYKDYSICYFAYHGQPGMIDVGKDMVTLDELAIMLGDSCKDKIIHFGSCLTLSIDTRLIKKFLEQTQALCVCGFKTEVDFLSSSVFDMMLIEMFQNYKDVSCVERDMRAQHPIMIQELDFKIVYL